MSKLNVDQKTIKNLLSDNKADFLIPDYQRPYAWDAEKECFTLWEDVFAFAIDFRFGDKMKYYNGYTTSKGDDKKATCVLELKQLAKTKTDFAETDIKERTNTILKAFGKFLDEQGLIK